jgi:hypothetical protein
MGLVVSFVPRVAASHPRNQTAGQAAAIIIFPGVRYERRTESADLCGRLDTSATLSAMPSPPKPTH